MFKRTYFLLTTILFLSLTIVSCGDDNPMEENNEAELTINSPCKYSITLAGELIENQASSSFSGLSCNVISSSNSSGNAYGADLFSNNSEESLSFIRGTIPDLQWFEQPTPIQFDELFDLGLYNYSDQGENGIEVTYTSSEEEVWSTSKGSADQSGSNFELLEKVSETISEIYILNLRVKFKCNLYNSAGDVKTCEGTATFVVQAS